LRQCSDDCIPCCDFCQHYAFNGEEELSKDRTTTINVYTGAGWCHRLIEQRDPGDTCDDFYCTRQAKADREEAKRKADLAL
jgi:hypothetical protein